MKKLQLIAFWMTILSFWGCSESLCPDKLKAKGDNDGGLAQSFYLRWQPSPNNYQYAIGVTGIYSEDTIRFYNENYEVEPTFYTDGRAGNFFYASPSTPRGQDLSKTYYLYLNYKDTDTIRIDYKINDNKCKPLLVYGKFFYNNQLITQNENENFIPVAGIDK